MHYVKTLSPQLLPLTCPRQRRSVITSSSTFITFSSWTIARILFSTSLRVSSIPRILLSTSRMRLSNKTRFSKHFGMPSGYWLMIGRLEVNINIFLCWTGAHSLLAFSPRQSSLPHPNPTECCSGLQGYLSNSPMLLMKTIMLFFTDSIPTYFDSDVDMPSIISKPYTIKSRWRW